MRERRRLLSEIERLQCDIAGERAVLDTTLIWLGGHVDGAPPHRGNFLQRIDELRKIEAMTSEARAILNPVCTEETLIGAIRNLQQAHLSTAGVVELLEELLADVATDRDRLRARLNPDRTRPA